MSTSPRIQTLEECLSERQNALAEAKKVLDEASVAVFRDPSDKDALAAVRDATDQVAGIQADIDILNNSRGAAERADEEAADKAQKQKAVDALNAAEELYKARLVSAMKLQKALSAFCSAFDEWNDLSLQCRAASFDFYRSALGSRFSPTNRCTVGNLTAAVMVPVVHGLHEAIKHGDVHHYATFNYTHRNRSVMDDAKTSGDLEVMQLRTIAQQEGLIP